MSRYSPNDSHPGAPPVSKKQKANPLPSVTETDLLALGLVKVETEDGVTHWRNPTSPLDKTVGGNFATINHTSKSENKT